MPAQLLRSMFVFYLAFITHDAVSIGSCALVFEDWCYLFRVDLVVVCVAVCRSLTTVQLLDWG